MLLTWSFASTSEYRSDTGSVSAALEAGSSKARSCRFGQNGAPAPDGNRAATSAGTRTTDFARTLM